MVCNTSSTACKPWELFVLCDVCSHHDWCQGSTGLSWFMASWWLDGKAHHMVHHHHPHVLHTQWGCECLRFETNPSCTLYVCIVPDSQQGWKKSNWFSPWLHTVSHGFHTLWGDRKALFNANVELLRLCAGAVSRFGSGLFLLVQVIILLDFTHNWNAAWVAKDEQFWFVLRHFTYQPCSRGKLKP